MYLLMPIEEFKINVFLNLTEQTESAHVNKAWGHHFIGLLSLREISWHLTSWRCCLLEAQKWRDVAENCRKESPAMVSSEELTIDETGEFHGRHDQNGFAATSCSRVWVVRFCGQDASGWDLFRRLMSLKVHDSDDHEQCGNTRM
jgi:hypothetical protein